MRASRRGAVEPTETAGLAECVPVLRGPHHHGESPRYRADTSGEDGGIRGARVNSEELKRWGRIAAFWSLATFLGHWVIWPLPMYGSHYVFEKNVWLQSLLGASFHFQFLFHNLGTYCFYGS